MEEFVSRRAAQEGEDEDGVKELCEGRVRGSLKGGDLQWEAQVWGWGQPRWGGNTHHGCGASGWCVAHLVQTGGGAAAAGPHAQLLNMYVSRRVLILQVQVLAREGVTNSRPFEFRV